MKTGVVIVNTARGAVMDEDALVKAIDSGKVWSVGLDVFEEEPKIHPGLVANRNVCLLPHMGTWTVEVSRSEATRHGEEIGGLTVQQTQTKMGEFNIANCRAALEKGKLNNVVPEQADLV
jgi:glyoxylate reductase